MSEEGGMHHLILIREVDQASPISPHGRISRQLTWDASSELFPERRERRRRIGEAYRAVRTALPESVEVTMLDPRNLAAFVWLVVRDALRFGVPFTTALRTLFANRASAGILDGQVLFEGMPPAPTVLVERIRGRLDVHRV